MDFEQAQGEMARFNADTADALARALPLLVRLGDFIGNGEPDRVGYPAGSLADRCSVIGAVKDALEKAGT